MNNTALVNAGATARNLNEVIDLSVIPQELFVQGQRSIVKVIRCGGIEGLTVFQIAEMTDIAERSVWYHIEKHAISTDRLHQHSLRSLKDAGIILLRAKRAVLVPKSGVQQLLKLINTPKSWAIYFQLWQNTEQLIVLQGKLADAELARDKAVHRVTQLEAEILRLKSTYSDLEARLDAAIHALSLGGNRKKRKFEIRFHRHESTDIFKNPVVSIVRVRKSVSEMNAFERKHFKMQHGTRSLAGTAKMLLDESTSSDVSNKALRQSAVIMQAGVLAYQNTLMPDEGRLFALSNSTPMTFFDNQPSIAGVFREAN